MGLHEDLAALIKNAYYEGRDKGGTMHTCADDAADSILSRYTLTPIVREEKPPIRSLLHHGTDPECQYHQPDVKFLGDAIACIPCRKRKSEERLAE